MKGLVLINAYPCAEKFLRQGAAIATALTKRGIPTDVLRNGEVYAEITSNGKICAKLPEKYDFIEVVNTKPEKLLESAGFRLFNPARSVETCDDKMSTYLALENAEIPLIESIPAPLCYTKNVKANEEFLREIAKKFSFPLVVKKSYGSFGTGVVLVENMRQLIETENKFLYEPHFYQKYIKEACGRDIRVMVIGGKAVAAMERKAKKGEFRSNIELGGEGTKITLSEELKTLAERTACVLKLDYCGIDLLESNQGAVVCEVNSNAFFEGISAATGVDIADRYAEYICVQMKKRNEEK